LREVTEVKDTSRIIIQEFELIGFDNPIGGFKVV